MTELDKQLIYAFQDISQQLILLQRKVLSFFDVSISELKILLILRLNPNIYQSKISELCCIDKPAISRLLVKMQQSGLITKQTLADNKKSVFINLSENGKVLTEKIAKKVDELSGNYFATVDQSEKQMLLNLISKTLKIKGNRGDLNVTA